MSMEALDEYLGGLRQTLAHAQEVGTTSIEGWSLVYSEILPTFVALSAGVVRSERRVSYRAEKSVLDEMDVLPEGLFEPRIKICTNLDSYIKGHVANPPFEEITFLPEAADYIDQARIPGYLAVKSAVLYAAQTEKRLRRKVGDAKRGVYSGIHEQRVRQ